jgi:hypothetical protein
MLLIQIPEHVCFWYSMNELCVACLGCESCMHVCLLGVVAFFGDRIERQVCGGGGDLWVSRGRRSGTSHSRQAIYLLHIWILLLHLALLYYYFSYYALFFYIVVILYIAIVGDLAPQVDLISSIQMTPLVTYSTPPLIRDLIVSIIVFGKLVVEPKTLGWEHSLKRFWKCFLKTLE